MADDGSDMNYKDSFVSKLFSKFNGVEYTDTFASVAKMVSIRLVLAIVTSKRWEVDHVTT